MPAAGVFLFVVTTKPCGRRVSDTMTLAVCFSARTRKHMQ